MKLGTLKHPSLRDGELVVVSRDNRQAVRATHIAPNLRSVMDNWSELAPQLEALYDSLNSDQCEEAFQVNQKDFHAPLPVPMVGWTGPPLFSMSSWFARHVRHPSRKNF